MENENFNSVDKQDEGLDNVEKQEEALYNVEKQDEEQNLVEKQEETNGAESPEGTTIITDEPITEEPLKQETVFTATAEPQKKIYFQNFFWQNAKINHSSFVIVFEHCLSSFYFAIDSDPSLYIQAC